VIIIKFKHNADSEHPWNNLNHDGEALMLLLKPSQAEQRWSTQQLRWFRQEQKNQPEYSSYFITASN
jgi:hypothetical protein